MHHYGHAVFQKTRSPDTLLGEGIMQIRHDLLFGLVIKIDEAIATQDDIDASNKFQAATIVEIQIHESDQSFHLGCDGVFLFGSREIFGEQCAGTLRSECEL